MCLVGWKRGFILGFIVVSTHVLIPCFDSSISAMQLRQDKKLDNSIQTQLVEYTLVQYTMIPPEYQETLIFGFVKDPDLYCKIYNIRYIIYYMIPYYFYSIIYTA